MRYVRLLGIASNSSLNFQIPSIDIKLDRDNYSLWRSTIISALETFELETFELEAFVLAPAPPPETITVSPTGNQSHGVGFVANGHTFTNKNRTIEDEGTKPLTENMWSMQHYADT
ncbi:hypothetical protein LXL04_016036 [Taraxacum kok-saghyz]